MKVTRFEDLEVWKKARGLVKEIYKISSSGKFCKDWGLKDQITRAAVSVMSNIAEGFDSNSKAEFARFLMMSRRSISEIQSQLYVALDQIYISQSEFDILHKDTEEIRRMLNSFIKYLKGMK